MHLKNNRKVTEHDHTTTQEAQQPAPEAAIEPAQPAQQATWHTWMAAIGAFLALTAWIALSFNGYAALTAGVAAFAAACLGLRAHTRPWRNLAITALIASAVIMVVLTAFLIVIFWGLNSV